MVATGKTSVASALLLERAPWDSAVEGRLSRIPFDCGVAESLALLRRQVAAGAAAVHRVTDAGQVVGVLVTRTEDDETGRELVVIAGAGDAGEMPLAGRMASAAEDLARACSCQRIRFHTSRAAVARYAAYSLGYELTELVLTKQLQKNG